MHITLNLPDSLNPTETFNQSDWLREIAIALFQKELVTLGTASQIAGMNQMEFQQLIGSRDICIHCDFEKFQADIKSLGDRSWLQQPDHFTKIPHIQHCRSLPPNPESTKPRPKRTA